MIIIGLVGKCIILHLNSLYFMVTCQMTIIWDFVMNKRGNNWYLPRNQLMGIWDLLLQGPGYLQGWWAALLYIYYVCPW